MGRRTSGTTVGREKIGSVQANVTVLTPTQANSNISLLPTGTGTIILDGETLVNNNMTIANQADLRLRETSGNGTNYIAQQAAASMASNYTITWPSAVSAASGNVLSSDTSGNLSWVSPSTLGISVTDPGASATVHYPFFGTNSGSVPTSLVPNARSNLSFVPSTGELTVTALRGANIYGSTANSGTLTVRGTTSSTKATASVLMTDNVSSSSTTTGTLVVTGGTGISGNLNVGGTCAITSTLTVTGLITANGGTQGVIGYVNTTTTATLADLDRKYIVSNTAAITLTLPNTSTDGRTIILADGNNFGSFNVTVGRGTRTIGGLSENLILNVAGSKVELVYRGGDWKVFAI